MTAAAIFLYGTLLDRRVLAVRSGDARFRRRRLTPATLAGHRRVVLRGTRYPTLVIDSRAVVHGVLMRPPPDAMRRLAAYEGPPYRLSPIRVATARGPRRVRAWITPRWRADVARAWP